MAPARTCRAEPFVAAAHGAEQRQGVERRNLVVFGVRLVQLPHRLGIGGIPGKLVAGAVEHVHRFHETPLASGWRFRYAVFRRRCKPGQGRMGSQAILLEPQGMVVAQRLAPIRQCEIGVDSLGFAEGLAGVLEFKAVKRLQAGEERSLRLGRAGVGKVDAAQIRRQAAGGIGGGMNGGAERTRRGREADDGQDEPHATDTGGGHGLAPRALAGAGPGLTRRTGMVVPG